MPKTIYALLVGINEYAGSVSGLKGCVADVDAMHQFLSQHVDNTDQDLDCLVLKNQQASRQAVIAGFSHHLCQAGPDDTALFYFCGHGSQAKTAPEFYHLEPDRLDETLVCYDSRTSANFDLADKEISQLIASIAENCSHVTVVLDCCHSGSGTRNSSMLDEKVPDENLREIEADKRPRPVSSYIVNPKTYSTHERSLNTVKDKNKLITLRNGRHVVLSACQPHEQSKEKKFAGQVRGVFSHYLLQALKSAAGTWTYRDLFAQTKALTLDDVSHQNPVMEASNFSDLDRPFLGGPIRETPAYFTLNFNQQTGWQIDIGVIHGISPNSSEQKTQLAIFPMDEADLSELSRCVGHAYIEELRPAHSSVSINMLDGLSASVNCSYKAVVISVPIQRQNVQLLGKKGTVKAARHAIASAGLDGKGSLLVEETEGNADLVVQLRDSRCDIYWPNDKVQCAPTLYGTPDEYAKTLLAQLEHIARWSHMVELHNPLSKLPHNAVSINLHDSSEGVEKLIASSDSPNGELKMNYEFYQGEWHAPKFKIEICNHGDYRLYFMLFNLTGRFKVWAENLLPAGGVWLEPGENTWACRGETINASVPDELWLEGVNEYTDILKLIVSSDYCDATRFQQGNIGSQYHMPEVRSTSTLSNFEVQHRQFHVRDIGVAPQQATKLTDWASSELSITTVRPSIEEHNDILKTGG